MSESIGVFGGTFDPPHLGHLILASEAASQLNLSRVLWTLTPDPPHKTGNSITALAHRLSMLECAIGNDPRFELSRIEIERAGPHYTVDTIRLLRAQRTGAHITLLLGGDSLESFPRWREAPALLKLLDRLAVMRRPDDSAQMEKLEAELPGIRAKTFFIDALLQELSSREIRARVQCGAEYRCYLSPAVYEYIAARRLYQAE